MRPSPTDSATSVEPGTRRKGNDHWWYHAVRDKSGKQRWQLTPDSAKVRREWGDKNMVTFTLKPSVIPFDESDDEAPKKTVKIPSFSNERALQIVWYSFPMPLHDPPRFYAKSVKWDTKCGKYNIVFVFASEEDAIEFAESDLPHNYGDMAADTWMEGDISITRHHEMDLDVYDIMLDTK